MLHDEEHGPLEALEDAGGGEGPVEAPVPQPRPDSVDLRQVQQVVELPGPGPKGREDPLEQPSSLVQEVGDVVSEVVAHPG